MGIFLYFSIFFLFTPVLAAVIWLLLRYRKRQDALEDAQDDLRRETIISNQSTGKEKF